MNFVEPIRDPQLVWDIQEYLKGNNERDYIMFIIGTYTGLRISDILKLKVKDVKEKRYITLRETKTSKQRFIELNPLIKRELKWYCSGMEDESYLIKSREGYNKAITRDMAYKIISGAGRAFGLDNIGTHTLRKTFGYHYYKRTKDIAILQELFNHTTPDITLKYIGIKQDSLNKALREFRI